MKAVNIGDMSGIRPVVNFANRLETFSNQTWGTRTIPDCQLIYVISGKITLDLGPERYVMSAGDCAFYGKDSPHRIVADSKISSLFSSIHFNWNQDPPTPIYPHPIVTCKEEELVREALGYYVQTAERGMIPFPHLINLPKLEPLILQIVREYRVADFGYANVMNALLTQVLTMMFRQSLEMSYSTDAMRKVMPAIEAIRKDLNKRWTTQELAHLCGYHPTYFASLFTEATGHAPKHFMMEERVRKAKQLLLDEDSVAAVAERVGFSSVHYFCRQFKQLTGLTPSAYRQRWNEW